MCNQNLDRSNQPIVTEDGSFTFYSVEYQQSYHNIMGAKTETLEKFIKPSFITEHPNPHLLDIGFGLGYNALMAFLSIPNGKIVSLEKNESVLSLARIVHSDPIILEILFAIEKTKHYKDGNKEIKLIIGDAVEQVKDWSLQQGQVKPFTHVFLDAFSASVNPDLWTLQFLKNLYSLMDPNGVILTYSSALPVMSALIKAGFFLDYITIKGRKRSGVVAYKNKSLQQNGLSYDDSFYLKYSVRSIPNIDKGNFTKQQIKEYRYRLSEIAVRLGYFYPHKKSMSLLKAEKLSRKEPYET